MQRQCGMFWVFVVKGFPVQKARTMIATEIAVATEIVLLALVCAQIHGLATTAQFRKDLSSGLCEMVFTSFVD